MAIEKALTRSRTTRRLFLAIISIAAAVGAWVAVIGMWGVQITVPTRPGAAEREPLRFLPVLIAATIVAFGSWGLLSLLERLSSKGLRIWSWISIVVFVLTLPYMPGFTLGERVFLTVLHGLMFAILVPGMSLTSRGKYAPVY